MRGQDQGHGQDPGGQGQGYNPRGQGRGQGHVPRGQGINPSCEVQHCLTLYLAITQGTREPPTRNMPSKFGVQPAIPTTAYPTLLSFVTLGFRQFWLGVVCVGIAGVRLAVFTPKFGNPH